MSVRVAHIRLSGDYRYYYVDHQNIAVGSTCLAG